MEEQLFAYDALAMQQRGKIYPENVPARKSCEKKRTTVIAVLMLN